MTYDEAKSEVLAGVPEVDSTYRWRFYNDRYITVKVLAVVKGSVCFRLIHECGGSMGTLEISLMHFWARLAKDTLVPR